MLQFDPQEQTQRNINRNSYTAIQDNVYKYVVSKMAAILYGPHCVKNGSRIFSDIVVSGQCIRGLTHWHLGVSLAILDK